MKHKTISIRPPKLEFSVGAPAAAMYTAAELVEEIAGPEWHMRLVDVAYTPEHLYTIYVFRIWDENRSDPPQYVWADVEGDAGYAEPKVAA